MISLNESEVAGEESRISRSGDVVAADVFSQSSALQFVQVFPLREQEHRMHRALDPLHE